MEKKVICAANAPKAVGPYSQAIQAGKTLYVSGQLPVNPADGSVAESVEDQTRQSLANLNAILSEAGMGFGNVVKTTVLLDDIKNFAAMNAVYAEHFAAPFPARVCYQVAALPLGVKVEIDAVAVAE
ncbi:MAG: RidA family protein [Tidjanibacter sp.]|nr:RidA family protein [Tidjanibacter sp.]